MCMLRLGAHYLWCHIREAVTNSHLHGDIHVIYAQVSFPNLLNYDEFVYQVLFLSKILNYTEFIGSLQAFK